ncbi:MAG TPA: ankyrin repeat domain-containing protein [Casimicrobiaceae bacterium]|nr:ankyrin repeat domain-containing protein [Casimicrobiaceae bacterium]
MRIDRWLLVLFVALASAAAPAAAQQLLDDMVIAVTNDRVAEVKRLLARGIDADSVGASGDPLIAIAARNGSSGALDALLAAKAHVDARNRHGETALMLAALKGNLDMVKKLRARGASLDFPGWTPLIYAATGGNDDVVGFLLDQGANIDATSPNGTSALMMAVREHKISTAELLVSRGANVNQRNQSGATALDYARQGNETELAERLLRAGVRRP